MITNFTRQGGSTGPTVTSVNTLTGAVTLASADVPLTAPLASIPAAADVQAALVGLEGRTGAGVSAMAFDPLTGNLQATLLDGTIVTVGLDGRYQEGADTFVSASGTIVNVGADGQNLDLDVNIDAVAATVPAATAAEIAALAGTESLMLDIGGVVKMVPISGIVPVSAVDTFTSANGTVVNAGADGSNLDLDVDAQALFDAQPVATPAQIAGLAASDEVLAQLGSGAVVSLSISDLLSLSTDTSVAGAAFDPATGNLTLTMDDASTVSVPLDGRYVRTVNAVAPDAVGNVPVALTAVETGTDAARLALSPTNGTVFVVSGDPDPNANGKTYIWEAGTAAWYQVVGYDTPAMDARYVNQSGDTMAGPLTLHADPTTALQAATKQYVDSKYDWIGFPAA